MPSSCSSSETRIGEDPFFSPADSLKVEDIQRNDTRSGFERLEDASLQEAMRDSSAREISRCFEGTRTEHRNSITSWAKGEWKSRQARVLWMDGPAGVGKSAIAQTCTEELEDNLTAAYFFSRANGWDEPDKLIPTIAYQLATRYPSYRSAVDAAIIRNRSVVQAWIPTQFEELIVKPLLKLNPEDRNAAKDSIILIDGLDECHDIDAQMTIIDVVTTSAAADTTPFLWGFFSRPEPHIVGAFSSTKASSITWHLTLPVQSADADEDIKSYLLDGLQTIKKKVENNSISVLWPSKDSVVQLVDQSDGLFIYATSAVRFIDEGSGSNVQGGPERRLQALLDPAEGPRASLSKLDQLYLLAMDQIPRKTLPNTLLVLYANHYLRSSKNKLKLPWHTIPILSPLLGLSHSDLHTAISPLASVLRVASADDDSYPSIRMYHSSFSDFLTNVERSTSEYCIKTSDVTSHFYSACLNALSRPLIPAPIAERYMAFMDEFDDDQEKEIIIHQAAIRVMIVLPAITPYFQFCEHPDILERLARIDWSNEASCYQASFPSADVVVFAKQIPDEWRRRIIGSYSKNFIQKAVSTVSGFRHGDSFVLGRGAKKALLACDRKGGLCYLKPHPKLES
ncbi:hypothetical protein D9756_009236 [Leucocoprinus leucothites]|uniref:Nephrocystin 3-like N-terminal domain-containing protein n=1 Tax=Leucocoprinus leucothites TaxID=201217 RepID=A0A8H5CY07_9AGAR|nr:hypothetical protein D9756_009236 [Leucoagaricus leucothites]